MDLKDASDIDLGESAVDCPDCGRLMRTRTTAPFGCPHRPSPSHKNWKPGDPQIIAVNQMCFVCPICRKAYTHRELDKILGENSGCAY